MKHLNTAGFRSNKEKRRFLIVLDEVKCVSHIISKHGYPIQYQLLKIEKPKKEKKLTGFLNYLTKFIKNCSEMTELLPILLKKYRMVLDLRAKKCDVKH